MGERTNFNDTYKLGLLFLFLLPEEERQEDTRRGNDTYKAGDR